MLERTIQLLKDRGFFKCVGNSVNHSLLFTAWPPSGSTLLMYDKGRAAVEVLGILSVQ